MTLHVIVGAGPAGSATAALLAGRGGQVRIITRSGTGPAQPGIEHVAADAAADAGRLAALAAGAAVLYNCASPPYHRWPQDWPPLAAALLAATERTGAVLVTMSNLYGYRPVSHPMTENDPLAAAGPKGRTRAQVWAQAPAAHQAGRARVTEARASDYFGPGVRGQSPVDPPATGRAAGQRARRPRCPAQLDLPARHRRHPGHPRRRPAGLGPPLARAHQPPLSQRDLYAALARIAATPPPRLWRVPPWLIRAAGITVPYLREFSEVAYQFSAPFVIDSTGFETTFGAAPTPMDAALAATVS